MKKNVFFLLSGSIVMCSADTLGLWRFDDLGAAEGETVIKAVNQESPGILDAPGTNGNPVYSIDVPAAEIFDPVSESTYRNVFSIDVTAANSQFLTENALALDTSFTLEFFVKYTGEPGSYESIFRRQDASDLAWRIDFDHAANADFGKIRTRWDTPAGLPDNLAETGIDENVNFVLRPQANSDSLKAYIDTGAKDAAGADVGLQNTGKVADYVFDAASANPSETDVALQGDGTNDVPEWHHVALTFDETTGEIRFYFNYRLVQTSTLSDSEGDGYTHPAAGLNFGKLSGNEGGLLLDEIRYSNAILSAGEFLREAGLPNSEVIGHWRFEEDDALEGGEIFTALNSAGDLNNATLGNGTPIYSSDVPAAIIYDPLTDTNLANQFSFDASTANSRLRVENDPALNTSFTLEFFIKMIGEPDGYHSFVRRQEAADLRWQFDFDHGNQGAYGRLRTRFDTPVGEPDGVSQAGVDENNNFVLGPTGGANIPDPLRLWIDTDSGDGMATSYDDATDWSLDGDGLNDSQTWHHAAITFDQETGEIGFYYDYELMQARTLSDSEGDGYTHPDAFLEFGKLSGATYGMLIDELRYSGDVILPFQFLQTEIPPASGLVISDLVLDSAMGNAILTWTSTTGRQYTVQRSTDLVNWDNLSTDEIADGPATSFTDSLPPQEAAQVFYRVIQNL
ncbi:MAG: hypothetical protein ACJAVK_000799 [Akkermansiaceae bacterium]|jgi:hypothetical protein